MPNCQLLSDQLSQMGILKLKRDIAVINNNIVEDIIHMNTIVTSARVLSHDTDMRCVLELSFFDEDIPTSKFELNNFSVEEWFEPVPEVNTLYNDVIFRSKRLENFKLCLSSSIRFLIISLLCVLTWSTLRYQGVDLFICVAMLIFIVMSVFLVTVTDNIVTFLMRKKYAQLRVSEDILTTEIKSIENCGMGAFYMLNENLLRI